MLEKIPKSKKIKSKNCVIADDENFLNSINFYREML